MTVYDSNHVKNVVLLGHTGSGKTTLAEAMLFESNEIQRRGSVELKNTVADYTDMEHEKGKTVFSKLLHLPWRGYKINILDTPGYDDLSGEVLSSTRVADCGLMLLNAQMGVEVSTDVLWNYADDFKFPIVFAINHLDHEKADFDKTLLEAQEHFGAQVVAVQYPMNQGENFNKIIDILHMVMYVYASEGGKPEKRPIPESEIERAKAMHQHLVETIASNDEGLMERFFESGTLTEEEMKLGLHNALVKHEIFPVFCISAKNNMGPGRLMGFIDHICPAAHEMTQRENILNGKKISCSPDQPTALFVFKTIHENHVGDLSFFKVLSGIIEVGDELVNENTGQTEKINQLYVINGAKRTPVQKLYAGDLGATLKLKNTGTHHTLHAKEFPVKLRPVFYPTPTFSMAIETTKRGEEEKLSMALQQIVLEDPSVIVEHAQELRQTLIHTQGELHLSIIKWRLEMQHKLQVTFSTPRIRYRETITKPAETVYRHKKQSGGAGQFAEVSMRIEPWHENMEDPKGVSVRGREIIPLPWGGTLEYINAIVGGAIDTRFHPSILKGIMEKMEQGPLTQSHVRDIRVVVFDGKMHAVDSNDISFRIAGMMAFKECFNQANPQLLEPVSKVQVKVPEDLIGTVMGITPSHRGLVQGMETDRRFTFVNVLVPDAEIHGFVSDIKTQTQGRAKLNVSFSHFELVSHDIQKQVVSALKQEELQEA